MIQVTAELLRGMPLPRHVSGDNKEGRGQVLVVGGCVAVPGAIRLSAEAALRAGAGKLQIATCRSIALPLGLAVPEAMVIGLPETAEGCIAREAGAALERRAARADAILLGPGMMDGDAAAPVLADLLRHGGTRAGFVLDAGALDALGACLAALRAPGRVAVITPHAGEMGRILGVERAAVEADPLRHAREAAGHLGCVVVLKGGSTHVVTPEGAAWLFEGGTIGLGTSGSGDVLAGVIAGLLARGASGAEAAVWGVYLHAEAGRRLTERYGGIGLLARELAGEVPGVMGEVGGSGLSGFES